MNQQGIVSFKLTKEESERLSNAMARLKQFNRSHIVKVMFLAGLEQLEAEMETEAK